MQTERHFVFARTTHDLESFFPLLNQLRPHLDFPKFAQIFAEAHNNDGYELVALKQSDEIVGLMGYRFMTDFVRGKHIYIDDLVVSERVRSKGFGLELLKFAEELAAKEQCSTLRLCAAVENERGIQFYERNKWTRRAYAYVKRVQL